MDLGVNIMGANWRLPTADALGKSYFFPTDAELDYYAAKGFTHIRLPLSWERMQSTINGALDVNYLGLVHQAVDAARERGLDVVIDIHNYGAYEGQTIGSEALPVSAFADLWGKLGASFAEDDNVRFGLMNEPQLASTSDWADAANAAIAAIRDAGADQEVLVQGAHRYTYWDGKVMDQTAQTEELAASGKIVDPAGNVAFEWHQYLDNGSGQNAWVVSETIGVERLSAITEAARENGYKLYLGEFGVADNAASLAALDNMMAFVAENSDVWQGGAYWGAGIANPNYIYTVNPDHGLFDTAQMDILEAYTGTHAVETDLGDGTTQRDVFVDGREIVAMTEVVDADGSLLARTLFDADGNKRGEAVYGEDGSLYVASFGEPGRPFPYTIEHYDADANLVQKTNAGSSGAMVVSHYRPGEHSAYQQDSYNSDGQLAYVTEHTGNGHEVTRYTAGSVAHEEYYDASWHLLKRDSFDADGNLVQQQFDNADGTHTKTQIDAVNGLASRSIDFDANWQVTSVSDFNSDGVLTVRSVMLDDGSRRVEHYETADAILHTAEVLTAEDAVVSRVTYAADSYTTETYTSPGSSLLAKSAVYTLDGDLREMNSYDALGLLVTSEKIEDNGARSVECYQTGTDCLASVEMFDADGRLATRISYGADGLMTLVRHENADGTSSEESYSATNQDHPQYIDSFDVAGEITSRTHLGEDGSVTAVDHVYADGGHLIEHFFAGSSQAASIEVFAPGWKLESRTSYDEAGNVTLIQYDHSDGTHTKAYYTADNQDHPRYADTFDASYQITSRAQYDGNGQVTEIDHVEPDGSHRIEHFYAGSDQVANVETFTSGGAFDSRVNYADDGRITMIQYENANGAHTKAYFTPDNQDHARYIDDFGAGWEMISRTYFNDEGLVTRIHTNEPDGTRTTSYFNVPGAEYASKVDVYVAAGDLIDVRYPAEEYRSAMAASDASFDFSQLPQPTARSAATPDPVDIADLFTDDSGSSGVDAVTFPLDPVDDIIDVVHVPAHDLAA